MTKSKVSVCIGTPDGFSAHLLHVIIDCNSSGKRIMKFIFAPGKGGVYSDPKQTKNNVTTSGIRDVLSDGINNTSEFTYHDDGCVAWKWPSYNLYRAGSNKQRFDHFPAMDAIEHPFCFAQIVVYDKTMLSKPINLPNKVLYLGEKDYPISIELALSNQKF